VTVERLALPGGALTDLAKLRAAEKRRKPKAESARAKAPSRAKAKGKAKKGKPPCKYGPRGPDGLCPKKPPATFSDRVAAKATGVKLSSRSKKSVIERAREKAEGQAATELAGIIGVQNIKSLVRPQVAAAKKATKSYIARQAEIATGGAASKTVAGNLVKLAKAPVIPSLGKKAAAMVGIAAPTVAGIALVAGIGAYYATSKVMQALEAKKDKKITQDDVKFQAALQYRKAREDAANRLGRELSAEEHKALADAFKANLKTFGG